MSGWRRAAPNERVIRCDACHAPMAVTEALVRGDRDEPQAFACSYACAEDYDQGWRDEEDAA